MSDNGQRSAAGTIAYHDWHFGGNGDVKTFMQTLATRYGEGTSLADFERKAQMMNYDTYRAMFEGLQAHMWTKNSGRLLWMTHPAWPSNHWQIYTHDYDTHAAYYGVKKATEPVHVQMNLPDYSVTVVNSTRESSTGLTLETRVFTLDGDLLSERKTSVDAKANDMVTLGDLGIAGHIATKGMVLVALRLRDGAGNLVSGNDYWPGKDDASHRKLNALSEQQIELQATGRTVEAERVVSVRLVNPGKTPAFAAKLTLVDAGGERILPALYSDNYVVVMPGEPRTITIRYPAKLGDKATIRVRGWNVKPASARVASTTRAN
ncbi:MAG: hypothetical protein H7Y89_04955 [Steroidobacteraceae bacterium]|nr:hypothetical protein [Steroidobacteraceae bacterium]